ncbi:MAG: nucleotide exchange factor GrpE [Bacteroidia bacterium]|nr:nucleotide exchange factor GrpE [Bacteroidia bacterium]MDW8088362.1 nucleotide exchange factor GrpE [Bacteroidia bacterium]
MSEAEKVEALEAQPQPSPSTEPEASEAAEVKRLQEEVAFWKDQALRAAAELENYRRRVQRDLPQHILQAQADLLRSLLPLIDSLNRGLQAAQEAPDLEKIKEGLEITHRQLLQVLQRLEVTLIYPDIGSLPNPELHEVLSTVPAPEGVQPHTILEVVQPGYLFRGLLLRPAQIIVTE